MPELPEVETVARDLRGLVEGARIEGASCNWPSTIRSHVPDDFAAAIAGRPIEGVGRRGKQLLVWLGPRAGDSGAGVVADAPAAGLGAAGAVTATATDPATAPAVMTVHLKMTGQLFVVEPATPADRHVHLVLALADGREIRFRDIRKFGRIGLYRRDDTTGEPAVGEAPGVLALGAEPLGDDFTARRFGEMLGKRRGRLKSLLLNQDFVAGVGNIYADEALWIARLHPLRDAHTVTSAEAKRLHAALREILFEAVARRGSSIDDYTAPDGDGSMQEHLRVYQRAGLPCLRCSRTIKRFVMGGRSTHLCAWCQRLPASQRAAAKAIIEKTGDARLAASDARPQRASPRTRARSAPGATRPAATAPRRGPRWTELSGDGVLGRTADEESAVEKRRRRVESMRKAAATRRAAARSGGSATTADGDSRGGNA
jgi:formamidopyrimidine-DNA glycosylase